MYILGDGKVALVETPVEGYEMNQDDAPLHDRMDSRCACARRRLPGCSRALACAQPWSARPSPRAPGSHQDGCCVAAPLSNHSLEGVSSEWAQ